ncbi:MAG TPA: cobyrinate a,c-diamide synthase [Xanthobacteraceae bacterium]|jgi:cobyrinic acid a,c-diamide synthase
MTGRGLIISGPHSGVGKTTITLAVVAALARRGIIVRAAKAGPDYIDQAFHAAATGTPGVNLDSWAMPPALLDALLAELAEDADVLVIEGAMGLFDGIAGTAGRTGATADLAARFGLPVLLVLDVAGQAQSASAVARGFASHDAAVRIAGVILNRISSERHYALVSDAIAAVGIPVVGAVPRTEAIGLPERHLGLVQAGEHRDLAARLEQLSAIAERHIDLAAIVGCAQLIARPAARRARALAPPGQRIALASDAAFTFIYPHILAGWRHAGAEVLTFSPVADEPPPESCDCCWLPGGYPELHAGALAAAQRFHTGLARFAKTRPVHGECGGYMVLGQGLEDADRHRHVMTGLLGHATTFAERKLSLGYRTARLLSDGPLGAADTVVRGHEFHYASLISAGNDAALADLHDGLGRSLGPSGGHRGHVTGSFFHAIAEEGTQ